MKACAITKSKMSLLGLCLVGWMGLAGVSQGAGLLIADGGFGGVLEIKEHDVKVTINNGVAVTKVTQVFHNTEKRIVEALYTFPVPRGASVANFSMWIGGKEMTGEVLEKKRAREIYESYKQTRKDPGLLEQVDYKTFEMRIFPIPAEADQKIEVTYYQELGVDHDWGTYVYPLATVTRDGIDSRTTGKFAISLEVKSAVPITLLKSPSHGDEFETVLHSDAYAQASLETSGGSLARDVVLAYQLTRPKTGLDLVTSNGRGEDGYFKLTLTAGEDLGALDDGMDYVFVMDVSGSMSEDLKLPTSRNSIAAFLGELAAEDRFELISFNVQPKTVFNELRMVDDSTRAEGRRFLETQRARGGTVLRSAIETAYKYADPDRQLNVIVLSDGMTEQRERSELLSLIQARPRNARVFCIGVGNEVNKPLLEQIAEDSGGLASFISRGDDFDRQAKAFRRKLTKPVASDLTVDFDGIDVYDVLPEKLPNLYHGAPVTLYGRYRGSDEADVKLEAFVRGVAFRKSAPMSFPSEDMDNPEIDRMWALKKVDTLLKTADRSGSRNAVIDEVVRLGEGYSIVTEYTSFLVLENDAEFKRWNIDRKNQLRVSRDRDAQTKLRDELDAIRARSQSQIGPAALDTPTAARSQGAQPVEMASARTRPAVPAPVRTTSRGQGIDLDFGIGSGPVGPLFLLLTVIAARIRKRR